jgi:hypothetical protein
VNGEEEPEGLKEWKRMSPEEKRRHKKLKLAKREASCCQKTYQGLLGYLRLYEEAKAITAAKSKHVKKSSCITEGRDSKIAINIRPQAKVVI